jgi:preprotein translocase subunit SecE
MAEEKKANYAPAKAVTAVKKDDTKPGFFKRVGKWFREMKSELKKVSWPSKKDVIKATGVVVAISAALGIVVGLFDYLFSTLIGLIVG